MRSIMVTSQHIFRNHIVAWGKYPVNAISVPKRFDILPVKNKNRQPAVFVLKWTLLCRRSGNHGRAVVREGKGDGHIKLVLFAYLMHIAGDGKEGVALGHNNDIVCRDGGKAGPENLTLVGDLPVANVALFIGIEVVGVSCCRLVWEVP